MPESTSTQILVRYSPFGADRLKINAERTVAKDRENGREVHRWGVSVFGSHVEEGESVDDAVLRVCETAQKNGKTICVVTDRDLASIGMSAVLDEPPPKHHLLGVGTLGSPPDFEALSRLFDENRLS